MTQILTRHRLRAGVILALVGLISLFIASTVAAATLDTEILVVTDGTAPFEDWAPGDDFTSGPTSDGINDPGDDLNANNGIVRTGDTVLYRAAWSVNDTAATNLVATVTLGGDADAYWDISKLPPGTCKTGSGVSPDGQTLTCVVGSAGVAETFSLDLPVVVTYASEQGDILNATIDVTADASTPVSDTSDDTEVSAAPRWDLFKAQNGSTSSVQSVGGVYGYSTRWTVQIRGGDADPRGNSPLSQPITFVDHLYWSDPGQTSSATVLLDRNENIVKDGALPNTNCLESGFSTTHSCEQTTAGGDITWTFDNIDFADVSPGPTGGVAMDVTFDTFTPFSELELLNDATPGDNVGNGRLQNDLALSDPTNPGGSTTLWDPVDSAGTSNWGTGTENPANNYDDAAMVLGTGRSIDKSFAPRRSGDPARVVDNAEIRANARFDTGTNTADLTNPIICDKFDNSRFVLRQIGATGQASTVSLGSDNLITASVIEYGASSGWGTYTGPNDGSDDATDWYTQHTTQCGDGDTTSGWFTGAQVDWTNSGTKSIDAEDVNMVRVKVTGTVRPGNFNRITLTTNWTVLDNDSGEFLVNASAFYDDTFGWATSNCIGVSGNTCPTTPPFWNNSARPGSLADVYQHVEAPVYIRKEVCENVALDGCTDTSVIVSPGDVVPFFLYPQVSTVGLSTSEPPLPASGADADDVVVTDVLPVNISYVANSAFVDGLPQEPDSILADTPATGQTTLVWNLGTIPYGDVVEIRFNGAVSPFAANNVSLQNNVEIESPDDPSDSQFHRDAVGVVPLSASIARVGKRTVTEIVDLDTPIQWEIAYGNLSSENVEFADLVDILPYDGDPNGTSFNGTFDLTSVTGPFSYPLANGTAQPVEIWISSVDPATLDAKDGTVDGFLEPVEAYGSFFAGTGVGQDFPCQIGASGTGGCPALADVTAIRVIGRDPNGGSSGPGNSFLAANEGPHYLVLTMTPTGNLLGDFYGNKWGGRFEGLPLPVWSPAIAGVRTPNLVLGDLVWFDNNSNGTYEAGTDVAPPGVLINLLDASGNPVLDSSNQPITTTTDGDGRYFFDKLPEGTYIVEIDASNFAVGGPLEAATASTNNVDTGAFVDNDNEGVDHNASFVQGNGAVRSGQVILTFGTGPLNDNTGNLPINAVDADTNLTIDFAFDPPPRDYGDLPDSGSGTGAGNYETLLGSNGPSHIVSQDIRLGALVPDDEPDGQPTAAADGDDTNGTADEDGVVFLEPLVPGTTVDIEITTSAPDNDGYLSLFIDFNGDGDFDDPDEVILADQSYPNGTQTISVDVPADATGAMGVRARFTDSPGQGGASPVGPGSFGEIEDYILSGLGDFVWEDTDEDGLQGVDEPGVNGIVVNLLDGSGNPVLDSNGNPIKTVTMNDPDTGDPGYYEFTGLLPGDYIVEFELVGRDFTTQDADGNGVDGPDNSDPDPNTGRTPVVSLAPGEFNPNVDAGVSELLLDYGDLPDSGSGTGAGNYETLAANNGPSHIVGLNIRLGALNPDDEPDGQQSSAANGDDNNDVDDEDGLVFLTPLVPGTPARIQVTTFAEDGSGNLSLFIDFNGDGDFNDSGETILADRAYINGTRTITVNVPADASGAMGVRARFTDGPGEGGASPTGPGGFGEIEDYILAGLGDYVWEDVNDNGLQDNGEPGVNGTVVNLLDSSGNPVLDSNGDPITTVTMDNPDTNEPGYYEFPGLLPGDYIVEFIPVGREFTIQNADGQGVDGAINSDPDATIGRTPIVSLEAGEFNPNIDAGLSELLTACPVPGNELTTILGSGMGNHERGRKVARVNIPNYTNVTSMYAQFAAAEVGPFPKRVRFMTNEERRVDLPGPSSFAYRPYAVYLYSSDLLPARWAKARVWLAKGGNKIPPQRAFIVYPTYQTTTEYTNVFRTFEESIENHVYWEDGWVQEQTFVAELPYGPLTEVTVNAQFALVEDDDDGRPIIVTVSAGTVSEEFVLFRSTDRDMLSIVDVALENVPAGTTEVVFHLYSPGPFESGQGWSTGEDGGDSVSIVGVAANYECPLP